MKPYFIGSKFPGCTYVRCLLPMYENGWNGSIISIGKKEKNIKFILQEVQESDIIIFHRANSVQHHKLGQLLKSMGKKIVFDNDDTYKKTDKHPFHMLDEKGFEENHEHANNLINNFIINSDLVTCSTDFLADEYRELNPNVIVLPNCVDQFDWDEPLRNEGEKVRIGIVGSTAQNHDFEHVRDFLIALSERDDVQLVLFGLHDKERQEQNRQIRRVYKREFDFWNKIENLEHVPFCSMEDYFKTLNELRLDIMLIPRCEADYNRSKSNLKFLEAGMCEIPVIAQSFTTNDSPYDKDLNGENGILIKDNSKWMEEVDKLIKDKELRRTIGKNAKKYVLDNYSIQRNAHFWEEAYKTICDTK